MKKFICLAVSFLTISFSAHAVLMEKDLESTLAVLHAELKQNCENNREMMDEYTAAVVSLHNNLVEYDKICQQLGLMLYSQETEHDFAQVYVCQQVEALRDRMDADDNSVNNFNEMLEYVSNELARMESLKATLLRMDPSQERDDCLDYLDIVMSEMLSFHDAILLDKVFHDEIDVKIKDLSKDAEDAFGKIQHNIFVKGRDNYFYMLGNLGYYLDEAKLSIDENYTNLDLKEGVVSNWRGTGLLNTALILFMLLPVIWLLVFLVLICIPAKCFSKDFKKKRSMLSLIIALALNLVLLIVASGMSGFSQMVLASIDLMVGLIYTMLVICISLYFRADNANKGRTLLIYMPFMLLSFVIILLRMILIPDPLMDLCFPPIMLLIAVLQLVLSARLHKFLPGLDRVYSAITGIMMIAGTCVAWAGFSMFSTLLEGWWIMQLSYILTISCLSYFIQRKREQIFKWDWLYILLNDVLIPILYIISVPMSLIDTATVYEMDDQLMEFFKMRLTGESMMVNISIYRIFMVGILFFAFKYLRYIVTETYNTLHLKRKNKTKVQGSSALTQNIISILIWGTYAITAMLILNVPKDGISLVTAGLATGLGFAMKDLIENFVYGMQLMAGRLKVGDVIECDGVNGVVDKISYQSTMLVTFDGCVVAFLNGALFKRNFKNKTRNHSKVRQNVTISVAYGTDLDVACKVALDSLTPYVQTKENRELPISDYRPINVIVKEMGESGIDLEVRFWTKMENYTVARSLVLATVYDAFNKNGVSIPFPQVDVHMIPAENQK